MRVFLLLSALLISQFPAMAKLFYNYHLSGVMQPAYRRVRFPKLNKIYTSKVMTYDPKYLGSLGAKNNPTMYYDPLNKIVSPYALISNAYGSMYVVAPPNLVTIETVKNPLDVGQDVFKGYFKSRN